MKKLITILILVLSVCGVGVSFGDVVYTSSNFQDFIALGAGGTSYYELNWFYGLDFTFDGEPNENVYLIGTSYFSTIDSVLFNIAGYPDDWGNGPGTIFHIYSYGYCRPEVTTQNVYIILDNGDKELFSVDGGGQIHFPLPGDKLLLSESISINGQPFGDLNSINYRVTGGIVSFDSIAIVTPPVTLVSPGDCSTGIDPNSSLVWDGDGFYWFD